MISRAFVAIIGLISLSSCLVGQVRKDDRQSSEDRAQFIGTWELVSTEQRLTDGSKRPYLDLIVFDDAVQAEALGDFPANP